MSTTSQASQRITALLDENSFVEIGALVTARSTDFNLKQTKTPSDGVITGYTALVDNKKVGLSLVAFCNVSLAVHDDEHINCFKEDIAGLEEVVECYCTGGVFDFLLKIVLRDMNEFNHFVFDKLTKVHGIVKMQSSFVLSEIKHTTALNVRAQG